MSKPKLQSWSFSTHNNLQKCPARVKYAKIDKLPDPSGRAAQRGNQVHEALERYILGDGPFPAAFRDWRPALDAILEAGEVGEEIVPELEFALTSTWKPTSWEKAKIRGKIDLLYVEDDVTLRAIDFKTGRKYDYHAAQLELYGTVALHLYPWVENVKVENWYLDQPAGPENPLAGAFSRTQHETALFPKWQKAAKQDLARTTWPAKRNEFCKWCPFHVKVGGPCTEGA